MFNLIEKLYLRQKNNLAYHDQLCGCYNRNYYELELKKIEDSLTYKYVTVIDINSFKLLNDHYGHKTGDAALKNVVDKAKESTYISDYIIRYGGDEFVLITKNNDIANIKKNLQDHYHLDISYGTVRKTSAESLDSAVDRADKEMYKMKKTYYEEQEKLNNV